MGFAYLFHRIVKNVYTPRQNRYRDWKAHHHYTIIDAKTSTDFLLRCVNLRSVFEASLQDIVSQEFYRGLSAEQACYIGLLFGQFIKKNQGSQCISTFFQLVPPRYGRYRICYLGRQNNVCFIDIRTGKERHLQPRDIVTSINLIRQFDATQSYYIGFLAGIKSDCATQVRDLPNRLSRPDLHLV